jgi:hypothetical protein
MATGSSRQMRKELEQRLVERWPTWFNTGGDIRCTAMPRGFEHDDGWFDILWRLCEDLEPLVAQFEKETGLHFEVLQVKEKIWRLALLRKLSESRCLPPTHRNRRRRVLPYLRDLWATGSTAGRAFN